MSAAAPDPHVLDPSHSPTPFTASQIRASCPPGRTLRVSIEESGEPSFVRVIRFIACDEEGADQESQNFDMQGEALGPPETTRSSWLDLQRHASFPRDRTAIDKETISLPVGRLDCLRYTVTDENGGKVFWFARDKPGMPVRYTSREGEVVTSSATMISDMVIPTTGDSGDIR